MKETKRKTTQKKVKKSQKGYQSLLPPSELEVFENQEASLPNQAYLFDEDNTGNEDYHDAGDEYSLDQEE